MLDQLFDMLDLGLIITDRELKIVKWNRWCQERTSISNREMEGRSLVEAFPHLNSKSFQRNSQSVLNFGNFAFISQRLHEFIIPMAPISSHSGRFEHMQQSGTLGPLRNEAGEISHMFVCIRDVTDNVELECRLRHATNTDGLTGTYNRRFLEERLAEEFERYTRYKREFSILLFDIDHFKKVNDQYGHLAGDAVLTVLAKQVKTQLRTADFVARYGGEEFCCVLTETPKSAARLVAERLRETINAAPVLYDEQKISVSVSIGVAGARLEDHGKSTQISSVKNLLAQADEALYTAKSTGRNRVCVAP